jgi:hypothetical protein
MHGHYSTGHGSSVSTLCWIKTEQYLSQPRQAAGNALRKEDGLFQERRATGSCALVKKDSFDACAPKERYKPRLRGMLSMPHLLFSSCIVFNDKKRGTN